MVKGTTEQAWPKRTWLDTHRRLGWNWDIACVTEAEDQQKCGRIVTFTFPTKSTEMTTKKIKLT